MGVAALIQAETDFFLAAYGYAYFAPTIIKTYGYSAIGTQLHSVPPWACAFGFSMLVAFFSDWARHRFLFAMVPIFIAIAGFAILMVVHNHHHVEYAALFLITSGTYSAMPIIVCWFTMNLGEFSADPHPPSSLQDSNKTLPCRRPSQTRSWLSLPNRRQQHWRVSHRCALFQKRLTRANMVGRTASSPVTASRRPTQRPSSTRATASASPSSA